MTPQKTDFYHPTIPVQHTDPPSSPPLTLHIYFLSLPAGRSPKVFPEKKYMFFSTTEQKEQKVVSTTSFVTLLSLPLSHTLTPVRRLKGRPRTNGFTGNPYPAKEKQKRISTTLQYQAVFSLSVHSLLTGWAASRAAREKNGLRVSEPPSRNNKKKKRGVHAPRWSCNSPFTPSLTHSPGAPPQGASPKKRVSGFLNPYPAAKNKQTRGSTPPPQYSLVS